MGLTQVPPAPPLTHAIMDKGYDSHGIREQLLAHDLVPVIHQVLRDAPGFSHGEVSRCLRSRQSIWCSPQGWDTPGFSHGEEVTDSRREVCLTRAHLFTYNFS